MFPTCGTRWCAGHVHEPAESPAFVCVTCVGALIHFAVQTKGRDPGLRKRGRSCKGRLSLAFPSCCCFFFFSPSFLFFFSCFDCLHFNVLQHSSIIPRAAGQTHAWQIIVIKKTEHIFAERRVIMPALSQTAWSRNAPGLFSAGARISTAPPRPPLLPKCIQTAFLLRECNPPPAPCLPSYHRCPKSAQPIIQCRLRVAEPDCSVHKSTWPHVRAQVVNHDCQKTLE